MSIRRREHRHGRSYKGLHIDCNLPEAEWILLMNEVKKAVRDSVNSVALEDPKHSDHWESWLDDFIDGGIGERYFGVGNMGKKWNFEVDRVAVRAFMKLLVLLVASRERKSNRRSILFNSEREGLAVSTVATVTTGQEKVQIQRDGWGKSGYADVGERREIDKLEVEGKQDKMREDILFDDATPPGYFPTNKLPNTEFVFQTRLSDSNKVKFLYTNDTISLQSFLEEVHNKFGLGHDQGIESFETQIGNNIYVVDTPDERDWQQIMKIARGTPAAAEIIAKVIDL